MDTTMFVLDLLQVLQWTLIVFGIIMALNAVVLMAVLIAAVTRKNKEEGHAVMDALVKATGWVYHLMTMPLFFGMDMLFLFSRSLSAEEKKKRAHYDEQAGFQYYAAQWGWLIGGLFFVCVGAAWGSLVVEATILIGAFAGMVILAILSTALSISVIIGVYILAEKCWTKYSAWYDANPKHAAKVIINIQCIGLTFANSMLIFVGNGKHNIAVLGVFAIELIVFIYIIWRKMPKTVKKDLGPKLTRADKLVAVFMVGIAMGIFAYAHWFTVSVVTILAKFAGIPIATVAYLAVCTVWLVIELRVHKIKVENLTSDVCVAPWAMSLVLYVAMLLIPIWGSLYRAYKLIKWLVSGIKKAFKPAESVEYSLEDLLYHFGLIVLMVPISGSVLVMLEGGISLTGRMAIVVVMWVWILGSMLLSIPAAFWKKVAFAFSDHIIKTGTLASTKESGLQSSVFFWIAIACSCVVASSVLYWHFPWPWVVICTTGAVVESFKFLVSSKPIWFWDGREDLDNFLAASQQSKVIVEKSNT